MKAKLRTFAFRLADLALAPLLLPSALVMKTVRRLGVEKLPAVHAILRAVGVFPIRSHYYEPQFDNRQPALPFEAARPLPGIRLDLASQIALLQRFEWKDEFAAISAKKSGEISFEPDNGMFEGADASFYYNLIRLKKPRRIIEVGSGQSTLVALAAIAANRAAGDSHGSQILCVEPYEAPWLEATGVAVERRRVETIDPDMFSDLGAGDILFIDSSHVIRPQGDLVFLFLQILPALAKGVIVHVHDIYTPRNYPARWLVERVYLWNEQYLLEALLSGGADWTILASVNHLWKDAPDHLEAACGPHSGRGQPGSFYIVRN